MARQRRLLCGAELLPAALPFSPLCVVVVAPALLALGPCCCCLHAPCTCPHTHLPACCLLARCCCRYLETASGHHWLAQRVPDDSVFVTANQGRFQVRRQQTAGCRLQAAGCRLQAAGCRAPMWQGAWGRQLVMGAAALLSLSYFLASNVNSLPTLISFPPPLPALPPLPRLSACLACRSLT